LDVMSHLSDKKFSSYLQKILGISRFVWYNILKTYKFAAKTACLRKFSSHLHAIFEFEW